MGGIHARGWDFKAYRPISRIRRIETVQRTGGVNQASWLTGLYPE